MSKTFNLYCDESCHIEHDHKPYMFLGFVGCAYNQVKRHTERIKELKDKHKFNAEIKWTNVSKSKLRFYEELTDYFFDTDLKFRTVGVDKSKMRLYDTSASSQTLITGSTPAPTSTTNNSWTKNKSDNKFSRIKV